MVSNRESSFTLVTCAFLFCLIDNNVSALSSPSSPLNGYHFGATDASGTVRKVTNSNLLQNQPRPYVPDGLTEEQYKKIKNAELAEQQSMKFGMWGPRFNQVDGDPDSNWFNLPTLWTGGFSSSRQKITSSDKQNGETGRGIGNSPVIRYMRHYGLAYLVLLLSSQLLGRPLSARQAFSSRWIAVRVLLPLVALKPMNMFASLAEQRKMRWANNNGTTKLASAVAAFMTLLAFMRR